MFFNSFIIARIVIVFNGRIYRANIIQQVSHGVHQRAYALLQVATFGSPDRAFGRLNFVD